MDEQQILQQLNSAASKDSNNSETFCQLYTRFMQKNNTDVFSIERRKLLRPLIRDLAVQTRNKELMTQLPDKRCPIDNLSTKIADPFEILGLSDKTEVQQRAEKHCKHLLKFGSYCYNCSCGSGKTLVGIYYMFRLQCKTLIISSRNAVNDQWKRLIQHLYPDLILQTREGKFRNQNKYKGPQPTDVWIVTPQFLADKVTEFEFNPSLIIYDELHSLLSDIFVRVLMLPFLKVLNDEIHELPYLLGLSATIPNTNEKEYKTIIKVFGTPFRTESKVTRIAVNLYDMYDHYREDEGDPVQMRGSFDQKYYVPTDSSILKHLCDLVDQNTDIDPKSTDFKGIIMCHTIDASVYAALYVHKRWKCNVMLMRSVNEANIYIRANEHQSFKFGVDIDLKTLLSYNIGEQFKGDKYFNVLSQTSIIVGTDQRLKEGFNVENITWGICTKFVWSKVARVQMLGRIRRSSANEELNQKPRYLYVCSSKRPSNITNPKRYGPPRFTYDIEMEALVFQMENYVRI